MTRMFGLVDWLEADFGLAAARDVAMLPSSS
jgi:hypothetical protein